MKNLLIIGTPRSGKTSLANIFCDELGFSLVSIDVIVSAFAKTFPELELHLEPEKSEKKLAPYIFAYMKAIVEEIPNRNFVVEGCHISPKNAFDNVDASKYKIVCLGFPDISPERFLARVKQSKDKNDWLLTKNDTEVLQIGADFIKQAKKQRQECEELGVEFLNTSENYEEKLQSFVKKFVSV